MTSNGVKRGQKDRPDYDVNEIQCLAHKVCELNEYRVRDNSEEQASVKLTKMVLASRH